MDHTKYINLETFEIEDSPKGFIPCDEEIADIVCLLNQKGYHTQASCAGHNTIRYDMTEEYDISQLESLKKDTSYKIVKITDQTVTVWNERLGGSTYIQFTEEYPFDKLPIGFTYENRSLWKMISFYENNDTTTFRREDEEIQQELRSGWEALRDWANNLEKKQEQEKRR